MKILLGITGSVGAQLTEKLYKKLKSAGHKVRIIATESAMQFIDTPFKAILTTQEDEFREYKLNKAVLHVEYANWADCFILCPCTSNTLNKWQLGICDNIVLSTLKAYEGPIYVAPVMNTLMLKKDIDLIHQFEYDKNINILWPTTKTLACGDVGLGAYPHINDIVNIISGHKWQVPNTFHSPAIFNWQKHEGMKLIDHPGWFGGKRRYDIHTGIDLYCEENTEVFAFEDGEVVDVGPFTGAHANCKWWFDSEFVSIKGKSGTIIYGEIAPFRMTPGLKVKAGESLGRTVRILKREPRSYVVGHRMDMLHIELVETGRIKWGEEWKLDGERPKFLKDPTIYLYGLESTK